MGRVVVLLAAVAAAAQAGGEELAVSVTAGDKPLRGAPVRAVIEGAATQAALYAEGRPIPVQLRPAGGRTEVLWIVDQLRAGGRRTYRLVTGDAGRAPAGQGVAVEQRGGSVEVRIDGQLFARYDATTGPNKPYFHPLYGPGGRLMVRKYPLETVPTETHDHPHHRGLWFTHGEVNGHDFWSEGPNAGRTVCRGFEALEGGPVMGGFRSRTDWLAKDGTRVAEDVRQVRVWRLPECRILDFEVTVRATEGPLVFQDTKEGSFGIRLPDTMRVKGGDGRILTSRGDRDAAAWGKRAEWVDYWGTVEGAVMGVAILDHPDNPRHPTYWHVRDYGLFAANPFGVHDFVPGQPKGTGDLTVPAGGTVTFRYRVLLHPGAAAEAGVADAWAAYAAPPRVEVRRLAASARDSWREHALDVWR